MGDFWAWQIVRRLERGDAFWLPPGSPWWMHQIANWCLGAAHDERIFQHTERFKAGAAWMDLDLVFATDLGTPIDAGNFLLRTHYPTLARAGLPRVRFHDLRHTAATLLLEAGAHPRASRSDSATRRHHSS